MQRLTIVICLALVALSASPSQARYRHHYSPRSYSEAQVRYESCNCYFGYMGNGAGVCSPAVSCSSEGGRCRGGCPAQVNND